MIKINGGTPWRIQKFERFIMILAAVAAIFCMISVPVLAAPGDAQTGTNAEGSAQTDAAGAGTADTKLNQWEQEVLDQAGQTMDYEGRVYYAYGAYMKQLRSYLEGDDINMTEKEGKDAVKQLKDPNNAKAGAQSGYLYQVGGKPLESESLSGEEEYDGQLYPEFDPNKRFNNEAEYKASDLYKNNRKYILDRTNLVYESQRAMRQEMREIAAADRDYKYTLMRRPADAGIESITAPEEAGLFFTIAEAFFLALVIALVIWNWKNGTISMLLDPDAEHWNRRNTHRQRHRIRIISAVILIVIVALNLTVTYTALTIHSTAGSDRYIEQATDDGGICQHNFMEFRNQTHRYLGQNNIPQNTLDLVLTYRDYRFDYVKGNRSAMRDGDEEPVYRGVEEAIEGQIDLMAYLTKQDSDKIVSGVSGIYEGTLSNDIGLFIYQMRDSVRSHYLIGFILGIVAMILGMVMLLVQRHYVFTGMKDLAIGGLAATGLWGLLTALAAFVLKPAQIGLSSDAVYVMFQSAVSGLVPFMLVLLAVSGATSFILLGLSIWMLRRPM